MRDWTPDIFGHANRQIFARTGRARIAHRPPFAHEVSSRRAKSQPVRIPCSHWNYSLSSAFGESGVSIGKAFRARFFALSAPLFSALANRKPTVKAPSA